MPLIGRIIRKDQVVSVTSTTAFVVEKADGSDIFIVDTVKGVVAFGGATPVNGCRIVLPVENDAATPTLGFGIGIDGWYSAANGQLNCSIGGVNRFFILANRMGADNLANGPVWLFENATSTNPVWSFESDQDTGIGRAAADQLSLIAGGVEGLRITEIAGVTFIDIDQGTNDKPFINYKATIDADATSAISSLTTSGAVTHHIQIELNGTTAWIPVSTTDPT